MAQPSTAPGTAGEPGVPPTRQRLLEAAVRVFARRGYYGATVDDIVAESGSSKGAFYFYFPSKEALFLSLVEQFAQAMLADVQRAVEGHSGAQARVQAALEAGIRICATHPELARVFLVEAVGVNPEFERKRQELHTRFCHLIQGYLDAAVDGDDIPPLDTEVAARATFGAVNEVVVHHLSDPEALPLERAMPELARFILRGLGWAAPS